MNLEELQSAILAAIARRDELVTEAREKRRQSAEAEHAYKMGYAKALLQNTDGPNAETRKARAELAVDAELFRHKLTEAESDGLKMAVAAKADEISALQTLIRLQMTELDALRYGQHNQA